MAQHIRAHDWAATSLGSIESWPANLTTAVDIMLASPGPAAVLWGPERVQLYNDAYIPIAAERHPQALGRTIAENWPEAYSNFLAPVCDRVFAGETVSVDEHAVPLRTGAGSVEQRFFTGTFQPVHDGAGGVGGVFHQLVEITAKARVDAELRAERDRNAEILESISDAFYAVDAEWRFTYINRRAEQWWGRSREELLGKYYWDEFPKAVGSQPYKAHLRAAQTRDVVRLEAVSPILGHWVDISIYPTADGGLSVYFKDVSEKKQAEARLRESEARLAALFESLPVGVGVIDSAGQLVLSNPEMQRYLPTGTMPSRDEARYDRWRAFHADGRQVGRDEFPGARAIKGEVVVPGMEMLHTQEDGRDVWTRVSAVPIRDGNGEVTGQLAVVTDIDALKRTAEALRQSETRFREIADAAPVLIWISDTTKACTWFNRPWLEFTGRSMDQEYGYGWTDGVHPEDYDRCVTTFNEAFDRLEPFRMDYRLRRHDGEWRVVNDTGVPRFAHDGAFLGYIGSCVDVTEQREAEAAMRRSEEQLRLATEAAEVGLWDLDPQTDTLFWPPRVKAMFGISADRPISMADFYAGLHPDDAQATSEAFAAAIDPQQRALYDVEYRTIGKEDGAERWVAAKGRGIFDSNGRCVRVIGTAIDITERKKIEEQLRELNETLEQRVAEALAERKLLADLVENTDAFVQVADADFRWLAINKAASDEFERIYGVRPKVGDSMLELLADRPEHQAAVRAVWGRALAGEEFTETGEFGEPGRERRSYEMKYHVLRDARGERIGAYQFVYDVSERVNEQRRLAAAEAARRQADALYRAYFENSPEALFVVGVEPDGFVVEELNPAHEAGVGFKLEEVRGKRIENILPPEIAERVLATYRHVVETGATYQYREVFDFTGDPQHWDTSLVPVREVEGRITRLIGSSRNVTRQVIAEDALRQAQKMEAVGQLTGGIAHDFNNLLGAVVGSLDLIRRKPAEIDRVRRYAEAGLQAAERGAKLTGQLLAFSRAQRLEQKPVDVSELVADMRDMVDRSLGPLVRLTLDTDGDGAALTDPTQLEMAVLNLAINARDAMPDGGDLTIATTQRHIRGDPELKPGDYVELSVTDTGTGMPPEVVARAFDPFFTTKGVGKGTGLGLSQVYGLARQTGGTVRIDSRPGQGTTVRMLLPKTSLPIQTEAHGGAGGEGETGWAATVLVIDDDPDIRRVLVDLLEALDYRVLEAADGPEGLAQLERSTPDVMMVDFAMPGMHGAEVARVARERRPDLPIVFASGYADTTAIEEAVGKDAVVLRKPFRVDDVQAVLAEALNGRS